MSIFIVDFERNNYLSVDHSFTPHDLEYRQKDNFDIQRKRPMQQVIRIQFHLFRNRDIKPFSGKAFGLTVECFSLLNRWKFSTSSLFPVLRAQQHTRREICLDYWSRLY